MPKSRKRYSEAQKVALLAQVDRACPLCGGTLFHEKRGRTYSSYELAHIYPLNPTPREKQLLAGEFRLNDDVNHIDNLIPLCRTCHGNFDNPRTLPDYRRLLRLKSTLIERDAQKALFHEYPLELDVRALIDALAQDVSSGATDLEYDARTLTEKLDHTFDLMTRRKIANNVSDFYVRIREELLRHEYITPGVSELILAQIRSFYLKQTSRSVNHAQEVNRESIYRNVVAWIAEKAGLASPEGAEILTAFFIQNCEVFE